MLNVFIVITKKVSSNIKILQNFSKLVDKKIHRGPVYEDDGIYIKTKKICKGKVNTHFLGKKNTKRKMLVMLMLVINNARLCY